MARAAGADPRKPFRGSRAQAGARCAALAAFVISVLWPAFARADLASDAIDLANRWTEQGMRAVRLSTLFLEHGRGRPVRIPEEWLDAGKPTCTTIAFLSGRSTDFVVRFEPIVSFKHHASGAHVERSIAGVVTVAECGGAREALDRLAIEMRVARSALEIVVALGPGPAPPIAEMLPERASGPVAPLADPGPRGQVQPLADRARHAEQRGKTTGAIVLRVQSFTAEQDGSGREVLRLDEGCHRIELMADALGKRPIDLDAELRETTTERLVARDRSDAPDVRLEICAGSAMGVDLVFAGAPGPVEVLFIDALYPLPNGVPTQWGARARAGLAAALWRRKLPAVGHGPVEERLGVAGVTSIPIAIEPGSCYVAAMGTIRGEPRSVTLSARVDARTAFDSNAGLVDGSAVAFCSGGSELARIESEVRGSAVSWVLDVWKLGNRPFDEAR